MSYEGDKCARKGLGVEREYIIIRITCRNEILDIVGKDLSVRGRNWVLDIVGREGSRYRSKTFGGVSPIN